MGDRTDWQHGSQPEWGERDPERGEGELPFAPDSEYEVDDSGFDYHEGPGYERGEREPEYVPAAVMRWWRRFARPPLRPDRSPALNSEPHGRLDKLDLWLVVVLVIGAFFLRTYRLNETTGMYFDEVYHARTAMEFLQDWRYGVPHSIYEYTHPHFAKYAIAAGIYLFDDDQVKSTSTLGVPVKDAVAQTRLEPVQPPGPASTSPPGAASQDQILADLRGDASNRLGDRVFVATGSEVRAYDLQTREQEASFSIPGASSLFLSTADSNLYVGTATGEIYTIDTNGLDAVRLHVAGAALPAPVKVASGLGFAIKKLNVQAAIVVAIGSDGQVVSFDPSTDRVVARATYAGASDIAPMTPLKNVLVAIKGQVKDPKAEGQTIASVLHVTDEAALADLQSRLGADVPDGTEIALSPSTVSDSQASQIQSLANQGELGGIQVQPTAPRIMLAASDGLIQLDARHLSDPVTQGVAGEGARSITMCLDQRFAYVASGSYLNVYQVTKPAGSDVQFDSLSLSQSIRMPGEVGRTYCDDANNIVQVLGRSPDGQGWSSYSVEANGNSVFSDAKLPFEPAAWAGDVTAQMPNVDREQLLVFSANGGVAQVDIGQFSFSWRILGVVFGVAMVAFLYLLARILFRRRTVGLLVAGFALADGMLFAQSRIAMNDTYVGGWLLAAYFLFALLYMGVVRNRAAFWILMPIIGLCLGMGLASKWVALYAIASVGMLILFRSALGRLLVVLALGVGTGILGYLALFETPYPDGTEFSRELYLLLGLATLIGVAGVYLVRRAWTTPDRVLIGSIAAVATAGVFGLALMQLPPVTQNGGANFTFFIIMVAVTAMAAAVAAYHPVAWTREEMWFGIVVAALGGVASLYLGRNDNRELLLLGAALIAVPSLAFRAFGRAGFGPLAARPRYDDPLLYAGPPAPPPPWWLRLGSGFGLPAAWMGACLLVLPIVVYVVAYIPWAMPWQPQTEQATADYGGQLPAIICFQADPNNPDSCSPTSQSTLEPTSTLDFKALLERVVGPGWPAGHTGKTLSQLTQDMYEYHNNLRSPHAASSPWWAWPLDLKPVWFESDTYAQQTKSMIFDGGNLPMWWLAIPAMVFLGWQAFKRRSIALTLVGTAFFWQWLSWSRIDRASFQYHFYTALPFFLLALAYFVAELWHGPSRRTWLFARLAAAGVALGAPAIWLMRYPLCGLARVGTNGQPDDAYWQSVACGDRTIAYLPIDTRLFLIGGILVVALILLAVLLRRIERRQEETGDEGWGWLLQLTIPVIVAGAGILLVGSLVAPGAAVFAIPGEFTGFIGVLELLVGAVVAYFALKARDPRRFVVAILATAVVAFVVLYPNISALPLPGDNNSLNLADLYNGILPTWFYGFQFGVNLEQGQQVSLIGQDSLMLAVGVLAVAVVVAYAAWVRRVIVGYRRLQRIEGPEPEAAPGT